VPGPHGGTVAVCISSGFWPNWTTRWSTRCPARISLCIEVDGGKGGPAGGAAMQRNSAFILDTLDQCLDRKLEVTLHLLGGAALDLVYGIQRFSEDVDCLCTMTEARTIDSDQFQSALLKANKVLEPLGLYLTHIFDEGELVHLPDWTTRLTPPPPDAPTFRHVDYDAVSAEDIILSKFTRFDEKDRLDIEDLMRVRGLSREAIDALIPSVVVPGVWTETWEAGLKKWRAWAAGD
jgi:hypothetical protein